MFLLTGHSVPPVSNVLLTGHLAPSRSNIFADKVKCFETGENKEVSINKRKQKSVYKQEKMKSV